MRLTGWVVAAALLLVVGAAVATSALRGDTSQTAVGEIEDGAFDRQGDGTADPGAAHGLEEGDPAADPVAADDDGGSTLRVWALPDLPPGFEAQVADLPGVRAVTTTRRGLVHLTGSWDDAAQPVEELRGGYVVPLQALALDTSRADLPVEVSSLVAGEIALSGTAARMRGLAPGAEVDLDGHRFTVAAVAPDELAGSSEVLLSLDDADLFGFARRSVTVRYQGDEDAVTEAIGDLLRDVTARIRTPRDERTGPVGRSQVEMKQRFGEFTHGPVRSDGRFTQDPAWIEANITTVRVPILGAITCHREFIPLVAGALGDLEDAGLAHLIDATDYAGCWAPRRIASGRTISKHAWGAAIDVNASTNAYGEEPTLDPRVVDTFERWGMRWGGDFIVPDGMHFEWYEDPAHLDAGR